MENTPVYEWEDAIKYIKERCNLSEDDIETVLTLEEDYMKKVGIMQDNESDLQRNVDPWSIDGKQRTSNEK